MDGGSTKAPVTNTCLASSGLCGSDTPKLPQLLRFPVGEDCIHIMQRIPKYLQFGIMLLEDDTGDRTKQIIAKHKDNWEAINIEIVSTWLQGNGRLPCTWDTLVSVLEEIELKGLAYKIRTNLQ